MPSETRTPSTDAAPRPARPGPTWLRDRFLLGLLAVFAASLVVVSWPGGVFFTTSDGRRISFHTVMLVVWISMNLATAVVGYRVVALLAPKHPSRRFWWAWVASSVFFAAASAAMLASVLTPGVHTAQDEPPTLFFVFLGLAELVLLAAMLTYPLGVRTRRERVCLWLDMGTVLAGAAGFAGYVGFAAPIYDLSSLISHMLSGPVIIVLTVFALARLLLSTAAPFTVQAGLLVSAGAVVGGVATGIAPILLGAGRGDLYSVLITLTYGLLGAGARLQQQQCLANPTALDPRSGRRPYSRLPYVAIAATYVLLAVAVGGSTARTWTVLAAAAASTALVIARQLLAFAENAFLLGRLNTKVDELNHAKAVLQAALDERDALTDQLRALAFHDPLTGLANRALLLDRGDLATNRASRSGEHTVLILVDLDDFKPVNDRHGHAAGDAVLVETAARLRACVRDTDTVARLGGDEFALLMEDFDHFDPPNPQHVAERIIAALQKPIQLDDAEVTVGASLGLASNHGGRLGIAPLLEEADAAMYAAKHRGKGRYHVADRTTGPDRGGPGRGDRGLRAGKPQVRSAA